MQGRADTTSQYPENNQWPSVSVFVAARNEEKNLDKCLLSLAAQQYPGFWEVWIADDHSTDQTFLIASNFCIQNPNFQCFLVPDPEGAVKGKALALACMASKATGEVFLVCDADMQMPTGWVSAMVLALKKHGVDLINGTTTTLGKNWFCALQAIDWLVPQATFAWLSRLGVAYTAMGNNMGITRKAYEATGGYFNFPFSLTEDFELFRQANARGYRLIHEYNTAVLGISAPQENMADWLEQHIRWMIGFSQLPFRQRFIFYAQLLFYPLGLLSIMLGWKAALLPLAAMLVAKLLYEVALIAKLKLWQVIPYILLYELLWWPSYMICWLRFRQAGQVSWKGRRWAKQ